MKRIIKVCKVILGYVVLLIIGIFSYIAITDGRQSEYTQNPDYYIEEKLIEVEKVVDPKAKAIEDRTKELDEKYENIKRLEATLDVLLAEKDSIDAQIAATQKELAGFMTGIPSNE